MNSEMNEKYHYFLNEYLPHGADMWDRNEETPAKALELMGKAGMLGSIIKKEYGGLFDSNLLTLGELCEAVATCSPAVQSQITVHSMVSYAIQRWGSAFLKDKYLPGLASGEIRGSFALSEEFAGSDPSGLRSALRESDGSLILNGSKKWITYGRTADIFLVFAKNIAGDSPKGFSALILEAGTPGFTVRPLQGMHGFKASNIAELTFTDCTIDPAQVVGMSGFGLNAIAPSCLSVGRFCVAWGSIGMLKQAIKTSLDYTSERKQGGKPISQHQLVARLLSNMITRYKAARSMAADLADTYSRAPSKFLSDSFLVKYLASNDLSQFMGDAIQLQGANGLHNFRLQQMLLDARVMEIIEGSNEIQQQTIPDLIGSELLREWKKENKADTVVN